MQKVQAILTEPSKYICLARLSLFFKLGFTIVQYVKRKKWKIFVFVPEQPALSSWVLAFNLQKLLNFIGFSFNSLKI